MVAALKRAAGDLDSGSWGPDATASAVQFRDVAKMLERAELRLLQAPGPNGILAWFTAEEWETFRNVAQALAMSEAETTHAGNVLDSLMGVAWEGQDDE